jgi:hypothetical protein
MSTERKKLAESIAIGQAFREGSPSGARRNITVIKSGWGSSGYYAPEVIERDIPRIFPPGTQMYLNHPTVKEERERPERDLRDLVGKVIETPRMAGVDSVSVAQVYDHWIPTIDALAQDIGLSIRAFGVTENGAAGGKEGPIVQSLTEGLSIDYVTKAGAGGEVGALIESAREHTPSYEDQAVTAFNAILESAGKTPIPANLLKEMMKNGIPEDDIIFEAMRIGEMEIWNTGELVEAETYYDLFLERDVSKDERIALAKKGQAIPIKDDKGNIIGGRFPMANCEDVKAAAMSVGRGKGDDVKGFIKKVASKLSCPVPFKESGPGRTQPKEKNVEIDEKTLNATVASAVAEAMSKKDKEKEDEESKTKVKEAEDRATKAEESLRKEKAGNVVAKIVRESKDKIPVDVQTRVIEASLYGDLPVLADGSLDERALEEKANKEIKKEAQYIASLTGKKIDENGKVEGVGASVGIFESLNGGGGGGGLDDEDEPLSESDKKALTESFERSGMTKEAAEKAAEGR